MSTEPRAAESEYLLLLSPVGVASLGGRGATDTRRAVDGSEGTEWAVGRDGMGWAVGVYDKTRRPERRHGGSSVSNRAMRANNGPHESEEKSSPQIKRKTRRQEKSTRWPTEKLLSNFIELLQV